MVQWNGTVWKQVAGPSVGTTSGLDSVAALSPANAWAVGGTGSLKQVLILHWNGTAWTRS